jgi:hypothetical protein
MTPNTRTSFGLATTLAIPTAVVFLNPDLAAILYTAELAALLLTYTTAIWAPTPTSERAFRLLRWMSGKPEPTHPTRANDRRKKPPRSAPAVDP